MIMMVIKMTIMMIKMIWLFWFVLLLLLLTFKSGSSLISNNSAKSNSCRFSNVGKVDKPGYSGSIEWEVEGKTLPVLSNKPNLSKSVSEANAILMSPLFDKDDDEVLTRWLTLEVIRVELWLILQLSRPRAGQLVANELKRGALWCNRVAISRKFSAFSAEKMIPYGWELAPKWTSHKKVEPLRNNGTVDSAESYLGRERECAVTETGTTWTIFQRATKPPAELARLGWGESDWRLNAADKIGK